jgi:hypothetical protein
MTGELFLIRDLFWKHVYWWVYRNMNYKLFMGLKEESFGATFLSWFSLFVCFPGVTNHCGSIFHSPVAGFSLLVFEVFLITQRHATVGRTPLDEWSIRRRDLYLTTHKTHNRQTSMPPGGLERTIRAGEQPKTYALDRTATGTGLLDLVAWKYFIAVEAIHCHFSGFRQRFEHDRQIMFHCLL